MSAVNETLIRDIVAEVLGRLGGAPSAATPSAPTPVTSAASTPTSACGCGTRPSSNPGLRGRFCVFADANEACTAAQEAFLQLQKKGIAARRKIEEIVKTLADKNAAEWGRIELEETKIGRLDHKVEKLQIIKLVP